MKPTPKTVCPFCPLHCDDIQVDAVGTVNVDCQIARDAYANAFHPTAARIGRQTTTHAEVTRHIRQRLAGSVPVVVTSSCTLNTAKSLEQWSRDGRIHWYVRQSATQLAMQRAISRDGMIGATLGDVRVHADTIWIIGNRDQKRLPRIREFTHPTTSDASEIWTPSGVTAGQLGDLLDAARNNIKPHDRTIAELLDAASRATYFAVILADDGFDAVEADASAALLLELISILNDSARKETRRAVLVTFVAAQTAQSVSLWRRNEAPRDDATLSYDQQTIMIRCGESDNSQQRVAIQVGGRDPGDEFADIHVPVAVEGIHASDMVIRGDGAVTLPLQTFATSELPTSRQWLSEWLDATSTSILAET